MPKALSRMFIPQDTPAGKILYYHLLLFVAVLPLPPFYNEVVLVSLCLHTFIHLKRDAGRHLYRRELWILAAPFFITLLCTLYAPDTGRALKDLGKQAALLLLPLVFGLSGLDWKKYLAPLLTALTLSCTLCLLFLFVDALRVVIYYGLPLRGLFAPSFINHHFSAPLGVHASYLSLYAALSVAWCLYQLRRPTSRGMTLLYSVALAVLLVGLLQLAAKTILVALALIVLVIYPFLCLQGRKRRAFLALALLTILCLGGGLLTSQTFSNRLVRGFRDDLSGQALSYSVTDTRVQRWGVILSLVAQSPVAGYGAGTEKPLLKEAFYQHRLYHSYLNSLNAHNQYLGWLLRGGLVGLALFLGSLAWGFVRALKQRDFPFLSFLTLMVFLGLTENYLDVEKGIFFYGFFFTLFVCAGRIAPLPATKESNPIRHSHVFIKSSTISETVNS
jgi:O-antigen ligase